MMGALRSLLAGRVLTMPTAPSFWSHDGPLARALSPLSAIGSALTAARVARPGWQAPVPVVCCGNVTVGGAGKTTLVLDLAQRLSGRDVHILLRGYGGASRGVHRVAPDDPVSLVGDEALLLAQVAPTWTSADRAASARAAIGAGAKILLMDDGLQNPTLTKTGSILVIDGRTGFGNGRVLPAGPLREPVAAAAARCQAAVLIGPMTRHTSLASCRRPCRFSAPTLCRIRPSRPWPAARSWPSPGSRCRRNSSIRCARPGRSWSRARSFPDHHIYTARELDVSSTRGVGPTGRPGHHSQGRGSPATFASEPRSPSSVSA